MRESWQNLIDLIAKPKATFTRLKSKPKWVVAFLVYCFLAVVLAWATAPFTEQLLYQRLTNNGMSIEPIGFEKKSSFVVLLVPALIISIISWVVIGIIFTIASRIFGRNKALKFRHIYAAFIHISLIRALIYLVNIGMLPVFRRVEDIETVIDLKAIPGLHMLVGSSANIILLTFLSNLHLLSVWHVVIISAAVAALAETDRTRAYVTAIVIWLLVLGIEVSFSIVFAT